MTKPSIVFIGSGPVAAASLELLTQSFSIEIVITKPRPPHHHGSVPVTQVCEKLDIPIIEVSNKEELSRKIVGAKFISQVAVLIDFGIMVASDAIEAFPRGIINSHFSLLPEWRGADPITFSILSGQKRTGVCLMQLVEGLDEGPVLGLGIQEDIDNLSTPDLTEKLVNLSYALLRDLLPDYIAGKSEATMIQHDIHTRIPGYPSEPSYSRKLTKTDGILDFAKPAEQLEREVRAFIEWPKSRTIIAGKDVVVTKAHVDTSDEYTATGGPGKIFKHMKQLCVQTSQGTFVIDKLKPAGKSEMDGQAFLSGYAQSL